jgi:hypothetical protein
MNKELFNSRFLILCGLILFAAVTRLLPHYPNFTAVGAMALFGGAYFTDKKFAFIVPLAAMFITDLIIGVHSTMLAVYLGFIIMVVIGMTLKNKKKGLNVAAAALSASLVFFIITNFGMWAVGTMYPKNIAGLIQCYIAAIPFFHYTVLGDLLYAGVLFGAFELARFKFPRLVEVKA